MSLITQLFRHWTYQVFAPGSLLRAKYNAFKDLLRSDDICLSLIADLEELAYGQDKADQARVVWLCERLSAAVERLVGNLMAMSPTRYMGLPEHFKKIDFYLRMALDRPGGDIAPPYLLSLAEAAGRQELAGGKAANLGRVAVETDLAVPPGYLVNANAFHYFIEAAGLRRPLDRRLRQIVLSRPEDVPRLAGELMEVILGAEVPQGLAAQIQAAADELSRGGRLLAVRSSALAEDSELSFAGQYASELHVRPDDAVESYKRVLAGKYCSRALVYRISHGLSDTETAMSVLILPMIEPKAAGVLYTLDPEGCPLSGEPEAMSLFAVSGLGESLVDGSRTPRRLLLSRRGRPKILAACSGPGPVPLSEASLADLREAGLKLETLFGRPQDVEWAVDAEDRLFILQSRQFHMDAPRHEARSVPRAEVLASGLIRASGGVAAGTVRHLRTVGELTSFPPGAVAVTSTLPPILAQFAGRLAAVVAETGSRASHLASVARENGIPVLVGPGGFQSLPEGAEVTVDADAGAVYAGRVDELLPPPSVEGERVADPRFARILPLTAKLSLTDPEAPEFSPEGCKSLHDMVRFCHEKGVAEMFSLVGKGGRGLASSRKLRTELPLVLYLLDLEDGLFDSGRSRSEVLPEDIKSQPMWAFWWGLADRSVGWGDLVHVDWEELDRVSAGIFSKNSRLLASYAIISADYLHCMIRFGYHFSVLDSVCGHEVNGNYIQFRFKGGGGSLEQRLLRLEFLTGVLTRLGFECSTRGDMLDAKYARKPENDTQKRLAALGYLTAVTRLMDMGLKDREQVEGLVDQHLRRIERGRA
ncbi:PEP/pyruvate-binding domain-containing protein [Desulfovibrio aminophilus]|uniref:PEP/pyruvate-binding domain-containing protein n=1 Tax=Desulfovibrio aminophilus TaxID=81425 RepID=UPI0003FBBA7F|nr:PEP/pyruvate-binding domain-containing protein [Desulfovibrio aminophilus]